MPPSGILAAEDQPFSGKPGVHAPAGQPLMLNVAEHAGQLEQVQHRPNPRTIDNRASQSCRGVRDKPVRSCTRLRIARMADSPAHGGISPSHACTQLRKPTGAARPRRGNGRFPYSAVTARRAGDHCGLSARRPHPGPFRKLDAIAVLTGSTLPAPRDGGSDFAALSDVKAGPAFGDGSLNGLTAIGDEGTQHPTSLEGLGTVGPLPPGPQDSIGLGLS